MKNNNIITKILIFVVVLFLLINTYLILSNFSLLKKITLVQSNITNSDELEIIKLSSSYTPLSLNGFTKVSINLDKNMILHLYSNCSSLDMPTNEYQAYSIDEAIKKTIDVRPTTHDIIKSLFNDFNITILMTEVVDKRDDLYLANMFVKQDNKITNIDIKPSDAIALALRTNTPIYVKNELMDKYANKTCKS